MNGGASTRRRAAVGARFGRAALVLCFALLQLCLPGLQAGMLRLAPASAATAASGEQHCPPADDGAGRGAVHCPICAAALLPAAPVDLAAPPAPAANGRAPAATAPEERVREFALAAVHVRGPPA